MATGSEPLNGAEIIELFRLERKTRGVSDEDVDQSMRARLNELRSGQGQSERRPYASVEARVAALEDEVKRLRELIERKNG